MKSTFFTVLALLCLSLASSAQSTVDSIRSKYKLLPMPEPLSVQKTFPVIGAYQLSNAAEGGAVTVRLDETNKGIVWVDGLPQGTFKAYLKKAPGTYRIIAQKSASGKSIPEGTLHFDAVTNTLNIALGAYNEAEPTAIFAALTPAADAPVAEEAKVKVKTSKTKQKSKVTFYSATKQDAAATATAAPVAQ
jgi:hypothetical protein